MRYVGAFRRESHRNPRNYNCRGEARRGSSKRLFMSSLPLPLEGFLRGWPLNFCGGFWFFTLKRFFTGVFLPLFFSFMGGKTSLTGEWYFRKYRLSRNKNATLRSLGKGNLIFELVRKYFYNFSKSSTKLIRNFQANSESCEGKKSLTPYHTPERGGAKGRATLRMSVLYWLKSFEFRSFQLFHFTVRWFSNNECNARQWIRRDSSRKKKCKLFNNKTFSKNFYF